MKSLFKLGDIVYLKTDLEQKERIVTAITFRPYGVTYALSFCEQESSHFDIEITKNKNVLKQIKNN